MAKELFYFKLELGASIELANPLKGTQQKSFEKGIVYETTEYRDIVALCGGGRPQFIRCYDSEGSLTPKEAVDATNVEKEGTLTDLVEISKKKVVIDGDVPEDKFVGEVPQENGGSQ